MRTLIVTADDFGLSVPVNEAVEEANRRGILTAASLMVAAPGAEDGVARARRLPTLGVGLHLTMVDGAALLGREAIPDLLGADGRLPDNAVRFGVKIALSRRVKRQVAAEVRAQFEAFRRTGLLLDHVNGHHHFHQHPDIFAIILELAREFGVGAVRIPYEPFRASYQATGDTPWRRFSNDFFHRGRTARMRRRLDAAGIASNDRVFGLNDSGAMRRERVLQFLLALPAGVSELYCHPASRRWDGIDAPRADYDPEGELAALIDPDVVAAASRPDIRRIAFAGLSRPTPAQGRAA